MKLVLLVFQQQADSLEPVLPVFVLLYSQQLTKQETPPKKQLEGIELVCTISEQFALVSSSNG
ncbi:MAG: hypothetical protein K1Y36_05895 [Blastocatellia bacterium]|nr:hypothetical protein [Blastocatellia bacterium]